MGKGRHVRVAVGVVVVLSCLAGLSAQSQKRRQYLTHTKAAPVFSALGQEMPPPLEWPRWIAAADAATRSRVARGDEGALVNLVMFGTSFTSQPRITTDGMTREQIQRAVSARIDDFERALARPDTDERLRYARRILPAGTPVRPRLLALIDRVAEEADMLARRTKDAELLKNPSFEFAERSRLYRDRGLASDTSLRVNYAIEEALRGARARLAGTSGPDTPPVRRVAVIGPGLDVIDKQEGHDFYPPQTIQPFAIIDSLLRLNLAHSGQLHVTTFDVSTRVNEHLSDMVQRARAGTPYLLHLLLDGTTAWTPELLGYFGRFGDIIGSPVPVTVPPGLGPLRLRALAVNPSITERIAARDINITAEVAPIEDGPFDLIVATNVFLYYDRLQQALAMANMGAMLRRGGLLLSNNALVEVPSSGMRSIAYGKTMYSNREEDGDVIISYQKE